MSDAGWVGQAFAVPLSDGRFGAIQILPGAQDGSDLAAVALDGVWTAAPSAAEAVACGPLRGSTNAIHAMEPKPLRRFVPLGTAGLVSVGEIRSHGSFYGFREWIEWAHVRPKRSRPEASRPGVPPVSTLDVGGGVVDVRRAGTEVHIGPPEVPVDKPVRWEALLETPGLDKLSYEGHDAAGALQAAKGLAGLSTLWLRLAGPVDVLDASTLGITDLMVIGARTLHVGSALETLSLGYASHEADVVPRVSHPMQGRGLLLRMWGLRAIPPAIEGLTRVRTYEQERVREARLAHLAGYTDLEELRLDGAPGRIVDIESLASLTRLDHVILHDFYELEAARFPAAADAPTLSHVAIWGYRASDEVKLKERLRDYWLVELTGKKKDAWIAANLSNPFRDWVDEHATLGKRACTAYAAAMRKVQKAKSAEDVAGAARELVAALNKLHEKHTFDTVMRETAFEALAALVDASPVRADMAGVLAAFDADRDF